MVYYTERWRVVNTTNKIAEVFFWVDLVEKPWLGLK